MGWVGGRAGAGGIHEHDVERECGRGRSSYGVEGAFNTEGGRPTKYIHSGSNERRCQRDIGTTPSECAAAQSDNLSLLSLLFYVSQLSLPSLCLPASLPCISSMYLLQAPC